MWPATNTSYWESQPWQSPRGGLEEQKHKWCETMGCIYVRRSRVRDVCEVEVVKVECEPIKRVTWGTSLAVQWLRLCAPNAGDMGSIPGRGTQIPHVTKHRKNNNSNLKKKKTVTWNSGWTGDRWQFPCRVQSPSSTGCWHLSDGSANDLQQGKGKGWDVSSQNPRKALGWAFIIEC